MPDEPKPSTAYPGYFEQRDGDYLILTKPLGKQGIKIRMYDPLPWDQQPNQGLDKQPE